MVFDDEGHGFTKYSNLIKALKKFAILVIIDYNKAVSSTTDHKYPQMYVSTH